MAVEIERKYLVKGDFMNDVTEKSVIRQGYLCSAPDKSVRIRIRDDEAFLTIKGASDQKGQSRAEYEYRIPLADAAELFNLCEPGAIDKVRHLVPYAEHIWEVDVFCGDNEGLVMAEVELSEADESFELPSWVGQEVTGDVRYYNSMLARNPYKTWRTETQV